MGSFGTGYVRLLHEKNPFILSTEGIAGTVTTAQNGATFWSWLDLSALRGAESVSTKDGKRTDGKTCEFEGKLREYVRL